MTFPTPARAMLLAAAVLLWLAQPLDAGEPNTLTDEQKTDGWQAKDGWLV